jgi:hypothetical protein
MADIINDIRSWLAEESTIIAQTTASRVLKYNIEMYNEKIFGVSGLKALIIDVLPGPNSNAFSSQFCGILEVRNYASNSVSNGMKTANDGEDRSWDLFYVTDAILNRKSREIKRLTNFYILGIRRNGEPEIQYDDEQECPFCISMYEFDYLKI